MLVLALPDATSLARRLAAQLDCEWHAIAQHDFPDGECVVRIRVPVKARHVVLAAGLHRPSMKLLPCVFAADAARELGAAQVGLVAPYLPYMRQDQRFHPGEALTSRSFARLLSGSLDYLVTVDPHLHRRKTLDAIYPIPARVVPAAPAIAQWVRQHISQPLLVGPDSESAQWVQEVARLCGAPSVILEKTRKGDRDVTVCASDAVSAMHGLTPVLLDDIASTGTTLIAAAKALRGAGLPPAMAVCVHALFDEKGARKIKAAGIEHLWTCDTIPHPSNAIALAPALAEAIRSVGARKRKKG